MPYQGPADVTFSAEYLGRDPVEMENPGLDIHLENAGPGLSQLRFTGSISAPQDSTHVRVAIPGGMTIKGELKQAGPADGGGWLTFSVTSWE